jgi:hypothetical protein
VIHIHKVLEEAKQICRERKKNRSVFVWGDEKGAHSQRQKRTSGVRGMFFILI